MEPNRFEVYVSGWNFTVVDTHTGWESKEYKYHRHACNLMVKLEEQYRDNN